MRQIGAAALLYCLLVAPMFLRAGPVSVLALGVLVLWTVSNGLRVPRGQLSPIAPLLVILSVGLMGAAGHQPWDVMRDFWYLGKSVLLVIVGYVLAWYIRDLREILRVFLAAALVTALIHISYFVFNPEVLSGSIGDVRSEAGRGFLITALALAIITACLRSGFRLPTQARPVWVVLVGLCGLSLVLSFSRTFLFALVILLFAAYAGPDLWSLRAGNRAPLRRLAVVGLLGLVVGLAGYRIAVNTELGRTFAQKVGQSVVEVTDVTFEDRGEITRHWRAYESQRAWESYRDGNALQYLIGRGYGTLLNTGVRMVLAGELMQFIPTMHNGFAELLLKTGLIGVLCYCIFFFRVARFGFRQSRTERPDLLVVGQLLIGCVLALMAMTVTVSGLLNKMSMNPAILMLGALIAYPHRQEVERRAELARAPLDP